VGIARDDADAKVTLARSTASVGTSTAIVVPS
jgi:hypothetical protein